MVVEELKRRILALQRGDVPARRPDETESACRHSRADLTDHFPEGAVCSTDRGEVFVCEAALSRIYSGTARLFPRYLGAFDLARQVAGGERHAHFLSPLAGAEPHTVAFIDTETAGFHGRPLFLIGMIQCRDGALTLTQYFARTYAEEAGLLSQLATLLPDLEVLITFNGKAFDWPFVRDRMTYHRLRCEPSFAHLDLLHPSRRRWRSELPNCKLQTLERYLSGRWRSGDIPSDQIPQRYHDFVREQDARVIAPIFHHNRLDLIAMMELLIALVEGEDPSRSS
jgi:hypothetical protein